MAIYHLHLSYGSRGRGHIAANKMDYLACRGKYDKGEKGVAHIKHGYMPRFARNDPFLYWKSADLYERSNGRLFYEVQVALPSELTQQEQIALARDFSQRLTAPERLPHTLIVRRGLYDDRGRKLDTPANPHARLVFSDRGNDGIDRPAAQWFMRAQTSRPAAGGAAKSRKTKNRAWLFEVRELWAKLANAALEKGGHEARIDHRSLEAQGITERLPQLHRGVAGHMEKRGIKTERGERYRQRQESNARLAVLHAELAQVNQEIKTLLASEEQADANGKP